MAKAESSAFCLKRAEEAARLAAESHLVNVRDNLLAAERSWRTMAAKAASSENAELLRRREADERRSLRKLIVVD